MAAKGMVRAGAPGERQTLRATQIVEATERGLHILNDLLDITRSAFGLEIPITRKSMDVSVLAGRLVDEMSSVADGRTLKLATEGDTRGQWDESRLARSFRT